MSAQNLTPFNTLLKIILSVWMFMQCLQQSFGWLGNSSSGSGSYGQPHTPQAQVKHIKSVISLQISIRWMWMNFWSVSLTCSVFRVTRWVTEALKLSHTLFSQTEVSAVWSMSTHVNAKHCSIKLFKRMFWLRNNTDFVCIWWQSKGEFNRSRWSQRHRQSLKSQHLSQRTRVSTHKKHV